MEKANITSIMFFMIATSLGYFTVQLDVSIVNVSLPTIQTNLMASLSELQWIINIYILIFSATLLSAEILDDRYGSKYFLIAGYLTFLIGSILCATTHSIIYILIFRTVQGMGAAIIVSNSLAIINKKFINNKPLRTILITIWMSFGGVALTCGPIFGGIITSLFNWRYIFF